MRPPNDHGGTHLLPHHLIPHIIIDNNAMVVDGVVTPHDPTEVFLCKAPAVDDALPRRLGTILQELDVIAVLGKHTIDVKLHLSIVCVETKLVYILPTKTLYVIM